MSSSASASQDVSENCFGQIWVKRTAHFQYFVLNAREMLSLMWCWSDLMTITATRFSTLSKRCFQFSPSCSYYHCHFSQQIIRYRPSGRPQPALTCSYVNPSLHPSPHLSLFWSPVLFEVEVKRWEFISSYATPLNLLISQGFQSTGVFRSTAFGHGCRFPRPSFPKQRSFFSLLFHRHPTPFMRSATSASPPPPL